MRQRNRLIYYVFVVVGAPAIVLGLTSILAALESAFGTPFATAFVRDLPGIVGTLALVSVLDACWRIRASPMVRRWIAFPAAVVSGVVVQSAIELMLLAPPSTVISHPGHVVSWLSPRVGWGVLLGLGFAAVAQFYAWVISKPVA